MATRSARRKRPRPYVDYHHHVPRVCRCSPLALDSRVSLVSAVLSLLSSFAPVDAIHVACGKGLQKRQSCKVNFLSQQRPTTSVADGVAGFIASPKRCYCCSAVLASCNTVSMTLMVVYARGADYLERSAHVMCYHHRYPSERALPARSWRHGCCKLDTHCNRRGLQFRYSGHLQDRCHWVFGPL